MLYKDDPLKVARIMDKLLDRDVHQLIKSPVPISYYSSNPPVRSQLGCRPLPTRKELDTPILCPASPPQAAFIAPITIPDPTGATSLSKFALLSVILFMNISVYFISFRFIKCL